MVLDYRPVFFPEAVKDEKILALWIPDDDSRFQRVPLIKKGSEICWKGIPCMILSAGTVCISAEQKCCAITLLGIGWFRDWLEEVLVDHSA